MRLDYLSEFRYWVLGPLLPRGGNSCHTAATTAPTPAAQVIELLDAYGLSREDLFETLQEMQLGEDVFKKVHLTLCGNLYTLCVYFCVCTLCV